MVRWALALVGLMLCLPLGVTTDSDNTEDAVAGVQRAASLFRTELLPATSPVPKPSAGTWTFAGLPTIPIESSSWTNSDTFVMGFRTRASGRSLDDWSLYEIRLSDQSVSRIYSRRASFAKSVADGTAVLAFTGWPVSPDNDAVINVIGPSGELIPVAAVPDDFFILDAS